MPSDRAKTSKTPSYIGRFAPTPSGPLHMGSLVCALASYLDAKVNQGQWLVRIEDIDKPREQAGASEAILQGLQAHGLFWDGELSYQSANNKRFDQALAKLQEHQLIYRCSCIRKRLSQLSPGYDGYCRNRNVDIDTPHALRINLNLASEVLHINTFVEVDDRIQPKLKEDLALNGDFMLRRKDGLYAYHLAVVADDIAQGITDIVRGFDLYDCTPHQIFLTRALAAKVPRYAHIPVVSFNNGRKLSKQNHAPAIDSTCAVNNLIHALELLQLQPPRELKSQTIDAVLNWGTEHWRIDNLKEKQSINIETGREQAIAQ